jgi:hypothetical protein
MTSGVLSEISADDQIGQGSDPESDDAATRW